MAKNSSYFLLELLGSCCSSLPTVTGHMLSPALLELGYELLLFATVL